MLSLFRFDELMCFPPYTFASLGLTLNPHQMVPEPTQEIEFLGVILTSVDMTATLPLRRTQHTKAQGFLILNKDVVSLFELASFWYGSSLWSYCELAPLRYKCLAVIRRKGLARYQGRIVPLFSWTIMLKP